MVALGLVAHKLLEGVVRTFSFSAGVFAVLALTGLCARAEPPSGFGPGEQSTYDVSYLGVHAGVAQITVGAQVEQWGKHVWPIVATAASSANLDWFPIRDKFVSYWDTDTQQTAGSDFFADENHKRSRQRVVLDHQMGRAKVIKQREGEAVRELEAEVKPGTRDISGVTFALRSTPMNEGDEYIFPVYTGAKSFDLVAHVEGVQKLPTPLGEREVVRIRVKTAFSGKLQSRRDLVAYYTTDPSHVMVRLEAELTLGMVVAQLTDYQPGKASP